MIFLYSSDNEAEGISSSWSVKFSFDTDRQKLLQTYDALSTESRQKLLDYAEDLMNSP